MKRSLKHSSSMKIKNSAAINLLEDRLFSKLQNIETCAPNKYDDLDIKLLNETPDIFTQLIYKAKGITMENQDKIKKTKRQLKVSKKEATGTFLTGTGIYTAEVEQQQPPQLKQPSIDYDPEEMLRNLNKKTEYDDLAQLRRMIKITDQNLGEYSRQVHQIKKKVINAATQFKNPMSFDLTYKLNQLEDPPSTNKRSSSMVRIKKPLFN